MSDTFAIQQSGDHCQVSGVLDFTTARQALEQMDPLVQQNQQLHVSLEHVTRCNSAALSLLIELKALARRSGHQVTFDEVPDGLRQLAKVCQVDSFLD